MIVQYLLPAMFMTLIVTTVGRIFYGGSLFNPEIAPFDGAISAGDVLFIGAILIGLTASWFHKRYGEQTARRVMMGALVTMFVVVGFVSRQAR